MIIINFEGREAKGLLKGRYDETFAGEDDEIYNVRLLFLISLLLLQVYTKRIRKQRIACFV